MHKETKERKESQTLIRKKQEKIIEDYGEERGQLNSDAEVKFLCERG